jgi:hypothetical protein
MYQTQLHIRQTLDTDPEINFVNWELNVQMSWLTPSAQSLANKASLALS